VVWLPGCYLPYDSQRRRGSRVPSRAEAGLPESGFVFASFNNSYKFAPATFDILMRLLRAVEGSVLWLPRHWAAVANFRREAEARGVSPDRLVFATYCARPEDHLARLSLADLFLDTSPYGAHSSAADALRAGIPVVTYAGNTFPGRVAASLLMAMGFPELVATSLAEYEALALRLARDSVWRAAIGERLARESERSVVFDSAAFARHLESAFETMMRRHRAGESPASFAL
jgi:predicted O-linked N-acetylglucosamine transferase (SPINDLY family)